MSEEFNNERDLNNPEESEQGREENAEPKADENTAVNPEHAAEQAAEQNADQAGSVENGGVDNGSTEYSSTGNGGTEVNPQENQQQNANGANSANTGAYNGYYNGSNSYGQNGNGGYYNQQNNPYQNQYGTAYPSNAGQSPYTQPNQNAQNQNNSYPQYGGNVQYKWNYDDYQRALESGGTAKGQTTGAGNANGTGAPDGGKNKKRGLKPFLITAGSVFGVAILGLAVIGLSTCFGVNPFASSKATALGTSAASSTDTGRSDSAVLNIQSQPSTSSTTVSGKEMTVAEVAKKVSPCVVGIVSYELSSVEPSAEGSGIVMTADGYILTNEHVIDGAQKLQVVLSTGKTYDATVIGKDTKTDLAVIKISATGLTYASFGNSSQLEVGQAVVAIGNPGGLTLSNSVTNGVVSGLNRIVNTSSSNASSIKYIQTSALINPGNSGGPLVNMYGQVVGINSAKITASGYEGIGFSIPINDAKTIVDSLIKNGYVTGRVKIGISIYSLSTTYAKNYNYPSGLYVTQIDTSSNAYAKGLRKGDIITKINGVDISASDADAVYSKFYAEESKHKAGESITLTVYHTNANTTSTLSVTLAEDKGDVSSASSSSNDNGSGYGNGNNSGNDDGSGDGYSGSSYSSSDSGDSSIAA